MKRIAVSQRVTEAIEYKERRDCLDQRWFEFLAACELLPIPIPNRTRVARQLLDDLTPAGVLLTGGNDLALYGGDAPERDDTETALVKWARKAGLPVLGVCRGMQFIQNRFGVRLQPVEGHLSPEQTILIDGDEVSVNSYHTLGTTDTVEELEVWALAADGVVKAIRHRREPIIGIMWHPERYSEFAATDLELFRQHFGQ